MKKNDIENLTAYCGLYCGDCIRYKSKASDLAKDILKEFEKTNFSEYAKVKKAEMPQMEQFEAAIHVLRTVSQIQCALPCRLGGDGCGGSCPVIECVKENKRQGCWECSDFKMCGKLDFLKTFHGEAHLKNLQKIKDMGIDAWIKHREKCYPWL